MLKHIKNSCIFREDLLLNVTSLWKAYPILLTFSSKLFFIGQLSYWLHCYPELYFQRVKREDILSRAAQATIGLSFILATYIFKYVSSNFVNTTLLFSLSSKICVNLSCSFQQVGILLLVLHYMGDAMLHGARIFYFISKRDKITKCKFCKRV